MLDIIIPVGPHTHDKDWLPECLESIRAQTVKPAKVILIDDMAGLDHGYVNPHLSPIPYQIWQAPWRIGCSAAWNCGVGLSNNDMGLCLLMGADDQLHPQAIEKAFQAYTMVRDDLGYYWMVIQYSDGELQGLPCNAAVVTKTLWKHTGGFPIEGALGAPDAAFISILLGNGSRAGNLHKICDDPIYWVRRHEYQDTARQNRFHSQIIDVRNVLTATWNPVEWAR